MKIGIDARFLTHPQFGGFKTYTMNLIWTLSQVDRDNHYVIYLDRMPTTEVLPQVENFTYRVVSSAIPIVGMPIREQVTLRRHIARDKPDVVHFLCNTAPIDLTEKYVLTLHDVIQVVTPHTFPKGRALADYRPWAITAYSRWAILNTARSARRIITVSHYEKDQITETLKIAPQRISVIHLAPSSVYSPLPCDTLGTWHSIIGRRLGLPSRYILGVGYEPRKNIPLLIEAFSRVAPCQPDLGLVIVAGREEWRQQFVQLASGLDVAQRVVVLAGLPPNDLAALYNLSDAFVFPSERESFGLPPLEALACGTPTIAMNMSSLPEILRDGAVLVNGKDVHTWASAIERVTLDRNLCSALVAKGLHRAAKLTQRRCAEDTVEVYRAVAREN